MGKHCESGSCFYLTRQFLVLAYNYGYEAEKVKEKCKYMTWRIATRKNKDADEITSLSSSPDAHGDIGLGAAKPLYLKTKRIGRAFK